MSAQGRPQTGQFLLFSPNDDDLSASKYGGDDIRARGNLLSTTSTVDSRIAKSFRETLLNT
jgi:uncharacterized Ntn-hydrolase superfamily protein